MDLDLDARLQMCHNYLPPKKKPLYLTWLVTIRQGPRFSIRMIIWIFCSDTLWWLCVFLLVEQSYFQRVRRQCCLVTICWGRLSPLSVSITFIHNTSPIADNYCYHPLFKIHPRSATSYWWRRWSIWWSALCCPAFTSLHYRAVSGVNSAVTWAVKVCFSNTFFLSN